MVSTFLRNRSLIGSRFTLHTSSPRSVTLTQLRFTLLTVTNSQRDLHPQAYAHAGRIQVKTPSEHRKGFCACCWKERGRRSLRRTAWSRVSTLPLGDRSHGDAPLPSRRQCRRLTRFYIHIRAPAAQQYRIRVSLPCSQPSAARESSSAMTENDAATSK